jgi:predicted amidophosphoribosyltransferase
MALPCHPQLLRRVKDTKPQMQTKSKQERQQNLAKAFAVASNSSAAKLRSVILFDDIYTTGTTIREAIATLANHQIAVRGVIVLARPEFANLKTITNK